jgi:hypothetical protein
VIGVSSKDGEAWAAQEFFQLFKTPWEFYVPGNAYDVVVVTTQEIPRGLHAGAVIVYQSQATNWDESFGFVVQSRTKGGWVEWTEAEFPIYGDVSAFRPVGRPFLRNKGSCGTVGSILEGSVQPTARIGIDLFYEVGSLLSQGQPAENAAIATLDLHIAVLRTTMVSLGVPFVEISPVPAGYDFIGCLTHDVDFVGIKDHKCDHTMWGFLYRATIRSLLKALKGELEWSECRQNWSAALALPLVHLGLREDFWLEFDRYMEVEQGLGSTFFFLPFKDVAGSLGSAPAPKRRAAKYDLAGIKEQILGLTRKGCEVGLHGIDAWQNVQSAESELSRIREFTGRADVGTRMHWLYWDGGSAKTLEKAGFAYDSTFGYNDAVGFRAGTAQPFCPAGAERMLELPLIIQDSAMFYSGRMRLSEADALDVCKEVIRSLCSSGGVLTVNWHTRSLSPERLWGKFYATLLKEIQAHRVWFATGQTIAEWFRKRRSLRFDSVSFEKTGAHITFSGLKGHPHPEFAVRAYHPLWPTEGSEIPVFGSELQICGMTSELMETPHDRPCTAVPCT